MKGFGKSQEEGVWRDVAFKNCLRIIKRVIMVTIGWDLNVLKAGPDVYFLFENWYEQNLQGTLLEDFMLLYSVSWQEMIEILIAIVNPLIAWKLNKTRPYRRSSATLQENIYSCLMCFTHLKLSFILKSPLFSALFEYLVYSGELDKFASTDDTFMLNPLRYMFILE